MHDNSEIGNNHKHILQPEQWVESYGDYLYNYTYFRINNKEICEDLIQETFISALKAKDSFRGESAELTWLMAILKRKVIDFFRKQYTVKEKSVSDYSSPFREDGMFEGHWLESKVPKEWNMDADSSLNNEEFTRILEYCLSLLPPKWRSVFMLKFMEELNSDEVCKEVGCSSSNFWVIMHRTRLKLRECMESNWLT